MGSKSFLRKNSRSMRSEAKYQGWVDGSRSARSEMSWSDEATARADKIPEFIRPAVMKEIERSARSYGKDRVDGEVINTVLDS